MAGLIRLLGQIRALDENDEPISLPTGRPREILVALALAHDGTISREALAGRIWGSDGAEARKALNTSLWRLREALKAHHCQHWIEVDGDHLRLDPLTGPQIDTAEIARIGRTPDDLADATARLLSLVEAGIETGEPQLAGDLAAEWLEDPRMSFQQKLSSLMGDLLGLWEHAALRPDAIELARCLVQIDPFDERGWRILIRSHLENGNRAMALRQFRELAHLFEVELGERPSTETRDLLKDAPETANFSLQPDDPPLARVVADESISLSARVSVLRRKIVRLDWELQEIGAALSNLGL